ncbi:MAG: ROK family protein, partial [Verrucomicrobia bacterium]|nr:ROK family protein [Verrucomicrobiota bacterium]
NLATVTGHVEALLRSGLALEADKGLSSGGRRPQLLVFNADAGNIVAIDLESTHVRVGLTDLRCNLLHVISSHDIDVARSPQDVLDRIKGLIVSLLKNHQVKESKIRGIGMGIPGPVKHSVGLAASLPIMPDWDGFPIADFWRRSFNCACHIDNNVYTMALGEQSKASDAESDNLIFLKLGNGIGAAIICDGRPYRGATETAGEVGHISIGHDTLCYCGNRGCLESFAGGRAIAARGEQLARDGKSKILASILARRKHLSLADVVRAVDEQDPAAVELIRDCGKAIGGVLAGLVNFYNPSQIIIGGVGAQVGDVLLASVRQAVYNSSLPLATRDLRIQNSSLGIDAGLVGAAILTVDEAVRNAFLIADADHTGDQQATHGARVMEPIVR